MLGQKMEDGSILVKDVKLPYVLKDKIIFSPGEHNGFKYSAESIRKGFENTQWSSRTQSLYHAHKDEFAVNPETGNKDVHVGAEIDDYAGSIKDIRYAGKGVIRGDIYIWDLNTALKMMGGAKVGISPAGKINPNRLNEVGDMVIYNWAVTVNPAIKTTFINSDEHWTSCFAMSEVKMDGEEEKKEAGVEGGVTAEDKLNKLVETVTTLATEIESLKDKKKEKDEKVDEGYGEPGKKLKEEDKEGEEKKKEKYPEEEGLAEDAEAEKKKKEREEEEKKDKAALAEIVKEAGSLSEDDAKVLNEKIEEKGLSEGKADFDTYRATEKVKVQESELNVLKEKVTTLTEDLKDVKAKPDTVLNLPKLDEGKTGYDLVEIEKGMLDYFKTIASGV